MSVWIGYSRLSRSPVAPSRRTRRTTIVRRSPRSRRLSVLTTGAGTTSRLRVERPLRGGARPTAHPRAWWLALPTLLASPLGAATVVPGFPTLVRSGAPAQGQVRHALHPDPHRLRARFAIAFATQPTAQRRDQVDDRLDRGRLGWRRRFLTVAYTDCHSSSSKATSQGNSGHSRPNIITYMTRQATIRHKAR